MHDKASHANSFVDNDHSVTPLLGSTALLPVLHRFAAHCLAKNCAPERFGQLRRAMDRFCRTQGITKHLPHPAHF
eukprot:205755-Amphidinium_carterae.1